MSAKLVVEKIETDVSFKYLNIAIEDDDETSFSEWLDGKFHDSKKGTEKSSHLVVKIVSGEEYGQFNLDSCAKELNGLQINNAEDQSCFQSTPLLSINGDGRVVDNLLTPGQHGYNFSDPVNTAHRSHLQQSTIQVNRTSQNVYPNKDLYVVSNYPGSQQHAVSPLEYSLERVKETNARIMENIHMLNRTLNYTKKKEILDIACPKSIRSYSCNTCGKCFVYETGLRRHYSMRHAIVDVQPRWQVVWTCIECFQVWPRQDVAIQHATQCCQADNVDSVREIKTSSLLQCEFCEKVFTSIPRLLRHAKTHTTASNYECNACDIAFMSYKTAEQHWLSCPWLKMCYMFSLPKLLLCNACDRKFRNYEHLYNHRYKVSHFITKTHHHQSHVKTLGVLVYQCELCGQWFPSVAPLQNHRIQYHPRYDGIIQTQSDMNYNESQSYNLPAEMKSIHELDDVRDQQY